MSTLVTNYIKASEDEEYISLAEVRQQVVFRYRSVYTAGAWNPTALYNWVPGMYYDYAPQRSDTRIRVYCHLPYVGLNSAHGISHWKFYADNIEKGRHSISGYHLEECSGYVWDTGSWDAGRTSRIGYQMRAYAEDNHEVRPYTTRYWDGGGSNQVCYGQFILEEYTLGLS